MGLKSLLDIFKLNFRNNLLKLDVYYPDLKYKSLDQAEGYSVMEFLGKIILKLSLQTPAPY